MSASQFFDSQSIPLFQQIKEHGMTSLRGIPVYDITRGKEPLTLCGISLETVIEIERQFPLCSDEVYTRFLVSAGPGTAPFWADTRNLITIPAEHAQRAAA